MSIKKSIETITLRTFAALTLHSGLNMDAVSAKKVEVSPNSTKTETLQIDSNGNISLSEIASKTNRTKEIRGDKKQIDYLYETGALRLIVNPNTGKREVLVNQAELEQAVPKSTNESFSSSSTLGVTSESSPVTTIQSELNKLTIPNPSPEKSPEKNTKHEDNLKGVAVAALSSLAVVGGTIWCKIRNNEKPTSQKIVPEKIVTANNSESPDQHEPTKMDYDVIESIKKMRRVHGNSIEVVQSQPIETSINPNGAPIKFQSSEGDFQLGTFYNTGELIVGMVYKNGMSLLNAGDYNNQYDSISKNGEGSSKLLKAQVDEMISDIVKEKYEVYTLSDVVLTNEFLEKVGPLYYIYAKPVISSGEITTNIVTLIAKKPGVDPAKVIKLIPSYGTESHTEMYAGKERKSELSYSAMMIELRKLALVNSYGSFLNNIESRKKDDLAVIQAIKDLKKWVVGGGDSNKYGIDTRDGNGIGKFLSRLFKENNSETIEAEGIFAKHGLRYIAPKKPDGSLETTFFGFDKLSSEMADGLKDKIVTPLKRLATTYGLKYSLDRVITNSDKITVKRGSDRKDHAQVTATHKEDKPFF